MEKSSFATIIHEQTHRALWEVKNIIDAAPDGLWNKEYCAQPLYKHIYHMLHSLDIWFVNPADPQYSEPPFHEIGLNDLDFSTSKKLTRFEIDQYYSEIKQKIENYLAEIEDETLLYCPEGCAYNRFALILAQFRHLHTHMGMIMGFIIDDAGLWPRVVGLKEPIPNGPYDKYF